MKNLCSDTQRTKITPVMEAYATDIVKVTDDFYWHWITFFFKMSPFKNIKDRHEFIITDQNLQNKDNFLYITKLFFIGRQGILLLGQRHTCVIRRILSNKYSSFGEYRLVWMDRSWQIFGISCFPFHVGILCRVKVNEYSCTHLDTIIFNE